MANLKYSRQREAIKTFLMTRKDHPTADVVYNNIRKEYPNISLGTVYRNLSLLVDIGEAIKVPTSDGAEHFDGNVMPHYHFVCTRCNSVIDLEMEDIDYINEVAAKNFWGKIEGHSTFFYGLCPECMNKADN